MSNHYHLMLWTPNSDLDRFMFYLNGQISKIIRVETGRINRIFGDRYKWSVIENKEHYLTVLKYIYQNPVRVGLSKECETYAFSSLYHYLRKKDVGVNLYKPVHGDTANFLKWINDKAKEKNNAKLSKAIRKPIFKLSSSRKSRRIP